MRFSKTIPAGLVDAGAASLSTFAVGLFAASRFDEARLGIWALFFAAYVVAGVVPQRLAFLPAEVRIIGLDPAVRVRSLHLSLPVGLPVAAAASLFVFVAWLPSGFDDIAFTAQIAVTAAANAIVSPTHDHARRVLHIANQSWGAAVMALVKLSVVAVFLVAALVAGWDSAWIPFGILIFANLAGLGAWYALSRQSTAPTSPAFAFDELVESGRWLAAIGLLPWGGIFVASAIVAALVGTEFVGFAEAARIAARPLPVFMVGLAAVIDPPSIAAGKVRDAVSGKRLSRVADSLMVGVGLTMLLWFGLEWSLNPMEILVSKAFEVEGLVALTIAANLIWGVRVSREAQLVGGDRVKDLFLVHGLGAIAQVMVAFTAPVTEAYAIPLSVLAFALVRLVGYQWAIDRLFREPVFER